MAQDISNQAVLELINKPAFCVKDGIVFQANEQARQRSIHPGDSVSQWITQDPAAYENFTEGCLFLPLQIHSLPYYASVTSLNGLHLFLLERENAKSLQTLALTAQQLRQSLSDLYALADSLKDQNEAAHMRQNLAQMHRNLCNMADVARLDNPSPLQAEPTNLTAFFAEVVEKNQVLLSKAGYTLEYTALPEIVIGMADRELLERSIFNLVSNAAKFSPKNSTLKATLVHSGKNLRFTIQDPGDGIRPEILQQVFCRYLREPAIEDGRHGIGLGLSLVCMAAAKHEGTVLIDQPKSGGTRVTMTLKVLPCPDQILRGPLQVFRYDYAGGHDHGLLELSNILPAELYK